MHMDIPKACDFGFFENRSAILNQNSQLYTLLRAHWLGFHIWVVQANPPSSEPSSKSKLYPWPQWYFWLLGAWIDKLTLVKTVRTMWNLQCTQCGIYSAHNVKFGMSGAANQAESSSVHYIQITGTFLTQSNFLPSNCYLIDYTGENLSIKTTWRKTKSGSSKQVA